MATTPLTDSGLKKLISDAQKDRLLGNAAKNSIPDGGGLALTYQSSGSWIWFYRYRFNGKPNRLSFGAYPIVTLGTAREKRKEAKELLLQNIDPSAHREKQRNAAITEAANTFKSVALLWWENWRKGKDITDRHAKATWRRLEVDVLPKIGNKPIHNVTVQLISPVIKAIEARAPSLADKAWVACGQIFRYACAMGIATSNPLSNIKRGDLLSNKIAAVNQKRVEEKEIPALLRAIDSYGSVQARLGLQLMALVFVRHSELRGARWDEFDFDTKEWIIPASRMKKTSAPTPHIIPLSKQALAIIDKLRQINGGREHVFPSTHGNGKIMSDGTLNKALQVLGYKDRHTVHGFRGMASTMLHEQGYPHEHIELQLAHMPRNKVSSAYNHAKYRPQRAKMMQDWADYLDEQRKIGITLPLKKA